MTGIPLITIVTVVYNDVRTIEATIQSVINQTDLNFEFIVIDGGSSDGTFEIIARFSDLIDVVVTEPDQGLYDAMNKGLRLATGKWIYFLNSGDYLLDSGALKRISPLLDENADVVHFNCKVTNDIGQKVYTRRYPQSIDEIKKWPCIQHQSVFTKTSLLVHFNGFDLSYSILADYDFFVKLYANGKKFLFHEKEYISNFNSQGISSQSDNISTMIKEIAAIQEKYFDRKSKVTLLQLYAKMTLHKIPFGNIISAFLKKIFLVVR